MIGFSTQGFGYFDIKDTTLSVDEILEGLKEGKYFLSLISEEIVTAELKVVAHVEYDETSFEHFDFELKD